MVIKTYLKLDDLQSYKIASKLSDYIWEAVLKWDWFSKRTLGIQFTESIDSIAGNLAEGFGRFHKKDKIKFYYNARASVYESAHWANKGFKRKILSQEEFNFIIGELRRLPKEINHLIKFTEEKLTI